MFPIKQNLLVASEQLVSNLQDDSIAYKTI